MGDYSRPGAISLTAVIAGKLATLAMQDSSITIEGESARARFLQKFLDDYLGGRMDVAAEVALGTGDCLVKPYTDGVRFGVDLIPNRDFAVCESIGNEIRSCIMKVGEIKETLGPLYERFEAQMVRRGARGEDELILRNFALKNGREIPLTEVPAWAGLREEERLPNVHKPLFGRYKSPAVNRQDVNSVHGVRITHGLDGVMDQAVAAYHRFNREYASGEKLIFMDKSLISRDESGRPQYPGGKENLFMLVRGAGRKDGSSDLIQEHAPDIRADALETGIEVNSRMVELLCGLSQGILTPPTTSYATATEMRAALHNTFAVITKFRRQLEKGTNDLLEAVDVIANRNSLTPMGPWRVRYDWSSAYIEQMNEHFSQLTVAEGIGAVDKAEVRSWLTGETYEAARARVEQIAEESGAAYLEEAKLDEGPRFGGTGLGVLRG